MSPELVQLIRGLFRGGSEVLDQAVGGDLGSLEPPGRLLDLLEQPPDRRPAEARPSRISIRLEAGLEAAGGRDEPGTLLAVELRRKNHCATTFVLMRVLWVKQGSTRTWAIGGSFERGLLDWEVQAWL